MITPTIDRKIDAYKTGVGEMTDKLPELVRAYHEFTGECFKPGALSTKEKQLVALGIALFANNEICTFYHVQEAVSSGATTEEVLEAAGVAAAVGGGHAMSQGVTRVQQALEALRG
jgi:AhpD family alkylhydroperoxidase